MKKKAVLQQIKDAAANREKILALRGKQLSDLPPEISQLADLTDLDLSFNTLSGLPPEITLLSDLTALDLSDNNFKELPLAITRLSGLTSLDLSGNQLSELPPEIAQLSGLTHLDLRDNRLSGLPPEISRLSHLTILGLSGNQLCTLPPKISRLSSLTLLDLSCNQLNGLNSLPLEISRLTGLISLDLSENHLCELPSVITRLTGLIILDLHSNQLCGLPQEINCLTNLTGLDLSYNTLSELPSEISDLTVLDSLDLHANHLNELPPEISRLRNLMRLDISYNRLSKLPLKIIDCLTDLTDFYLDDNPLISPPLEVAKQGVQAVQKYFAELEEKSQVLAEVKILLLGDDGCGKTSLTRCLFGAAFNENEPTTRGIRIKGWSVRAAEKQVKVNIWDFGGQEIMHAAHQLFLSKRSLYVLVLDSRRDDRSEYWLRHIESFGGDSPVLIVLNKHDADPRFDINRTFLQRKYPRICGFCRTSCATGYGIVDFKAALIRELTSVKFIETRWTKSWFKVKQVVENLEVPYLNYNQFETICVKAGITEEISQDLLVDFLNDLGVIIHFKKFELEDTHVLEPKWVTTAVYKIINAEIAAAGRGILPLSSLKMILKQQTEEDYHYHKSRYKYIIDLMKKFELCYALDAERVLIPQLLDVVEPVFDFDYATSLRFMLQYEDFLPLSILPRFIVKRHEDIKSRLRWRSGAVLENKAFQATAVVRADNAANRIHIYVNGAQRQVYLTLIRLFFREINNSFEKLQVIERVPMPDRPECTAAYTTLLTHAKKGFDVYIPDGSDKIYRVSELLDSVQPDDRGYSQAILGLTQEKKSFAEERKRLAELKPNVSGMSIKK